VSLAAGTYAGQWYSLDSRETVAAGQLTVEGSTTTLSAPFEAAGPAVLHLERVEG
jgi:hypothetical protein